MEQHPTETISVDLQLLDDFRENNIFCFQKDSNSKLFHFYTHHNTRL